MREIKHIIGGESVRSKSGKTFTSENPATEETIAEVAFGEAADVNAAVESVDRAFQDWSRLAPAERGKLLYKSLGKIVGKTRRICPRRNGRFGQNFSIES